MGDTSRKVRALHFEWWRFAILASFTVAIFAGISLIDRRTDPSEAAAMTLFGLSLLAFLAYRWHRLRVEVAAGRLTPEEFFRNARVHIRGPLVPFVAGFVITIAALIASRCLVLPTMSSNKQLRRTEHG
jgi:hypothetical protein